MDLQERKKNSGVRSRPYFKLKPSVDLKTFFSLRAYYHLSKALEKADGETKKKIEAIMQELMEKILGGEK